MRRVTLVVFAFCIFIPFATAQETRFELGQRLRLLERTLASNSSLEARKRALDPLLKATPTFFQGQLATAAGLLDQARLLLRSDQPIPEASLWAESLVVRPSRRFLDLSTRELPLRVESFYKVAAQQPDRVQVRFSLLNAAQKSITHKTFDLKKLPLSLALPLDRTPEGDYQLRSEVLIDGKLHASGEQTISLASDLSRRLTRLNKSVEEFADKPPSIEKATFARLLQILGDLDAARTAETNYPATRLLRESESVCDAIRNDKSYYTSSRTGQFWLSLPTATSSDPVRLQIPTTPQKGKTIPLVVALHGAGGSENMFFDGYGDGLIAKLCEKKGWMLVTTRSPLFAFGGGPDLVRIVDSLAKRYPIDTKKVFLVGHSMGAAQAVAAAGRNPDRFLAVAALGGGGGFKASPEVKRVRFFVGCGERDFALNGARNLHRMLVKAGVTHAVFQVLPQVEHLIVVQLALPDVFRFFEESCGS